MIQDRQPWWLVAIAVFGALVGGFAPSVIDSIMDARNERRRQEEEGSRQGAQQQEAEKRVRAEIRHRDPGFSPAGLLHQSSAIVAFFGRENEISQLTSWCETPDAAPVRLVVAPGGFGKTRLARHFGHLMERKGWACEPVRLDAEPQASQLVKSQPQQRWLLVLDYAEARGGAALANLLATAAWGENSGRVRVLLLARSAGPWWTLISTYLPAQAGLLDALAVPENVLSLSAEADERAPREVVISAAAAFAAHLREHGVPDAAVPQGFEPRMHVRGTPLLRLHAEALTAVLGDAALGDGSDILDRILSHESGYWWSRGERIGLVSQELSDHERERALLQMRHLVGMASLFGADDDDELSNLVRRLPAASAADDQSLRKRVDWLRDLYPADPAAPRGKLGTLSPDLLAEYLSAELVTALSDADLKTLFAGASGDQLVQALTVLGRARAHHPRVDEILDAVLAVDPAVMMRAAIKVAPQFPGVFGPRLAALAETGGLSREHLRSLAGEMPATSVSLARTAVALTGAIVAQEGWDQDPGSRAGWWQQHARRLAEAGSRTEAVEFGEQAVDAFRRLYANDPDTHRAGLAKSLRHLATYLGDLRRHADALLVNEESISLHSELGDDNAARVDLLGALGNRAVYLADLGRLEEALAANTEALELCEHGGQSEEDLLEKARLLVNRALYLNRDHQRSQALAVSAEALSLYRTLVAANRDAYLPAMALAANNHAQYLAAAGLHDQALADTDEATGWYRELFAVNPQAFRLGLARTVANRAMRLADVGRIEDALEASQEMVDLYGELAAQNEAAFLSDLGNGLFLHAIRLSAAGRDAEALAVNESALECFQRHGADSAVVGRRTAEALQNRAKYLAGVGRLADALAASRDAVDRFRALVDGEGGNELRGDLALTLTNYGHLLSQAGHHVKAVPIAEEGMSIYRELEGREPSGLADQLARATNTYALTMWQAGRVAEAVAAGRKSIERCRELVSRNPDRHLPELTMYLTHFAQMLAAAGVRDEALERAREAVELARRLEVGNRAVYLSELANALASYSLRLSEAGHHAQALTTSAEAVLLFEELVHTNGYAHLPLLARAKLGHANQLSRNAMLDEARAESAQVLEVFRDLAASNPGAFLPDLGRALVHQSQLLLRLGRHGEAMESSREAVEVYTLLHAGDATAHGSPLGGALHMHGLLLAMAEHHVEALSVSAQAVHLRRELAARDPAGQLSDLGASLTNHSSRLNALGRAEEAISAAKEAVDIYQRSIQSDRAGLSDYAVALNNYAQLLATSGRHRGALKFSRMGLDIYAELLRDSRSAHLPGYAQAVNNHARRLADAGRKRNALTAGTRAVELARELVAQHREAYLPLLAAALNLRVQLLIRLHRRKPALACAQEALAVEQELAGQERPTDAALPEASVGLLIWGDRLLVLLRFCLAAIAGLAVAGIARAVVRVGEVGMPYAMAHWWGTPLWRLDADWLRWQAASAAVIAPLALIVFIPTAKWVGNRLVRRRQRAVAVVAGILATLLACQAAVALLAATIVGSQALTGRGGWPAAIGVTIALIGLTIGLRQAVTDVELRTRRRVTKQAQPDAAQRPVPPPPHWTLTPEAYELWQQLSDAESDLFVGLDLEMSSVWRVLMREGHLLVPQDPSHSRADIMADRLEAETSMAARIRATVPHDVHRLTSVWPLARNHAGRLRTLAGHTRWVGSPHISADGRTLVTSSFGKTLRFWDVASGACRVVPTGEEVETTVMALAPDGTWLAIAGEDNAVRIWGVAAAATLGVLIGHTDRVWRLEVSPDGGWLASTSQDGTMRIWDTETYTARGVMSVDGEVPYGLAISPDGTHIMVSYFDGRVRIWDAAAHSVKHQWEAIRTGTEALAMGGPVALRDIVISPDGTWLAAASPYDGLWVWNVPSGTIRARFNTGVTWINGLAVSPDGTMIAGGTPHGTIVWDTVSFTPAQVGGHAGNAESVAFSPDGKWLATLGHDDSIQVCHAAVVATAAKPSPSRAVAAHPRGTWAATAGPGSVEIRDPATGIADATVPICNAGQPGLAIAASGDWLATTHYDIHHDKSGTHYEYSIVTWKPAQETGHDTVTDHTGHIKAIAISPDGTLLASGSEDFSIRIWDAPVEATAQPRAVVEAHTGGVLALAFAPDGTWLASAGADEVIRLWDTATWSERAVLTGHARWVHAVAIAPDGTWLASGGMDETIRIWDVSTATLRATLTGHTNQVTAVGIGPHGLLASAGWDGALRVWDPGSGRVLALTRVDDRLHALAWWADGAGVYATGDRGAYSFAHAAPQTGA